MVDTVAKPIVIKNTGKYGISFDFKVKGGAKDVFSVLPDTGTIDPGKDMTVQVWLVQGRTGGGGRYRVLGQGARAGAGTGQGQRTEVGAGGGGKRLLLPASPGGGSTVFVPVGEKGAAIVLCH